jgi:hypothetical protein
LSPLNLVTRLTYTFAMAKVLTSAAVMLTLAMFAVASTEVLARTQRPPPSKPEPAPAASPVDKRDSVVSASGIFSGRPYWQALAQCGGIYFKLNVLYTEVAVRARVVKPDPKANAEYTKELNEAIKTATRYFESAERFLIADRGMERADAVLTYDPQSRGAGERLKSIDAGLAAAKPCPALYQACSELYPKRCSEPSLVPSVGH